METVKSFFVTILFILIVGLFFGLLYFLINRGLGWTIVVVMGIFIFYIIWIAINEFIYG